MEEVRELEYTGKLFCGIISSNFGKKYVTPLKKLVNNVLHDEGALIYVYNEKKDKPDLKSMGKYFKIDMEEKYKNGQLTFVCSEEKFLDNGLLSLDKIIDFYEKEIDSYKEKGFEKIVVYTTRDSFYTSRIKGEELCTLHKRMKKICRQKNIMIVIKYIIDDFHEKDFLSLITLHDLFVLEDSSGGNVYTYLELIKTSLINLSIRQRQQEEYERELKRIENLKNLGELSESMSHDFNNILATIVGFSQMCLLKEKDEEVKKYLNTIYKTALDGKAMMNKIQSYIKGSYNAKKEIHGLNDLVKDSVDMIDHGVIEMDRKNTGDVKLIKELNSRKCIYCNEFEIRQVILNILLNAVDSITCDGVVKIKTYDKGKNSFIEVEDTGIGIEEDMLEKIFDPFFTTKGEHGTGLGLNIVKKVLNEHCADIKVESQVNKGSKFTIIFPSTTKEQLKVAEEEEEYKTAANILVVDDKYIVAKSIKELVSLLNMNADVETRGEKVMSRLSEKEYDLIICDYSMPYKNGIEVSQKVKKEYPNKPFILLTGFVDNIVENCDTIDYILNKPCTVEELADTIGKALKIVDEARSKSYNIS